MCSLLLCNISAGWCG
ncbi:hypothetical protein ABJ713_003380 [Escherichia coli]|nr:hypothetical protein [Escherichia coli]MCV2981480.1 hypothetical protein [Escherichia coli]